MSLKNWINFVLGTLGTGRALNVVQEYYIERDGKSYSKLKFHWIHYIFVANHLCNENHKSYNISNFCSPIHIHIFFVRTSLYSLSPRFFISQKRRKKKDDEFFSLLYKSTIFQKTIQKSIFLKYYQVSFLFFICLLSCVLIKNIHIHTHVSIVPAITAKNKPTMRKRFETSVYPTKYLYVVS